MTPAWGWRCCRAPGLGAGERLLRGLGGPQEVHGRGRGKKGRIRVHKAFEEVWAGMAGQASAREEEIEEEENPRPLAQTHSPQTTCHQI